MQRLPGQLVLAGSIAVLLAPVAAALPQELIWRVVGSTRGDVLGSGVARVGDFNSDGLDDLAIASMSDDSGAIDGGSVRVVDARTGATLLTITGKTSEQLGSVYRIGDVDHDGVEELLVNALGQTTAHPRVYSGATQQLLYAIPGDGIVAVAGDADGDGVSDIAIGAPWWSPTYTPVPVEIWSGADGSHLFTLAPPATASFGFGNELLSLGDVDGDGRPELAVGDPYEGHPVQHGAITFYSLASGAIVDRIVGFGQQSLGEQLADVGDFDGDGAADFAALVPFAKGAATDAYGAAVLCSGRTRGELARFEARAHERVVGVSATGDIDGDGTRDLALGVYDRFMDYCVVWIVGSRSGTRLRAVTNQDDFLRGIEEVPFVDLDGDGDDELVWADLNYADPPVTLPFGCVQVERSGPLFLTALPKHPRTSGNLKERISPPPAFGAGRLSDRLLSFHLAGFAPGSLAHLVVVSIDGVPMQLPAGSGFVHADGTVRIDWVAPSHLRPDRIEFVATGFDALGTPGTTGVDFVDWR